MRPDPQAASAGNALPPAPPRDHSADAIHDPVRMARSREDLRKENGEITAYAVLFDLAEYQARAGDDGYRWDSEAWFGGDTRRLVLRSEGEGAFGEPIEELELQALYSLALDPFWDLKMGLRYDVVPNPSRTHAVIGIEGDVPYVGFEWNRKLGRTARYARTAGEDAGGSQFVAGVRFWF